MAIALCAWLAHLNVLNTAQNYTEEEQEEQRPRKSCVVCSYWVDVNLATWQPITIRENFQGPPIFLPHLKRKNLFTSVCSGNKDTQDDTGQSISQTFK